MVVTSFEGGLGVSTGGRAVEVVGYLVVMVDGCGGGWWWRWRWLVVVVARWWLGVVIFTGILSERS